jgi:hypothetical protein
MALIDQLERRIKILEQQGIVDTVNIDATETTTNSEEVRIRQELTAIRILLSTAFKVNMTDEDVSKL